MRSSTLTTSAFDLPDRLAAKADPALIAGDEQHFAAIAESLERVDRRPVRPSRRRAQGARRHRPGGDGPRRGDPPAHRPPADAAPLRPRPVPRAHGRATTTRSPCTSVGSASPTATAVGCCVDWRSPAAEPFFGGHPRQPDGPGQPPPVPLDPRPDHRLLGRGVHPRRARRARAALDDQSAFIASLGSSRSPRMRDVLGTIQADQDAIIRAGSRGALVVDGGPGHRQDRRRAAPHGVPALLRPAPRPPSWRGAVRRPAPALPGVRRRRAAQPRRGGRADLHVRDLVPEGAAAAVETDPEVARLKSSVDDGAGDRAGRRGSTRSRRPRAWRSRRPRPTSGSAPPTGPRRSTRRTPARRTTRRATRSGRSCSRSWSTRTRATTTDDGRSPSWSAATRRPRAGRRLQPGLAAARADRPGRRPLGGAGLPAAVRPVAQPERGPHAAARGPAGLDGVRPAAPGCRPAAARRPRGLPTPTPPRGGRGRRARARWTRSSTT